MALDALIENAVEHTEPDARIELSARRSGDQVVLACQHGAPADAHQQVRHILFNRGHLRLPQVLEGVLPDAGPRRRGPC